MSRKQHAWPGNRLLGLMWAVALSLPCSLRGVAARGRTGVTGTAADFAGEGMQRDRPLRVRPTRQIPSSTVLLPYDRLAAAGNELLLTVGASLALAYPVFGTAPRRLGHNADNHREE